jgi:hypothetical protein
MAPFIISLIAAILGFAAGILSHKLFGKKNPVNCEHEFIFYNSSSTLKCCGCGCSGWYSGINED